VNAVPLAPVSLDLDDHWTYLLSRGDPGWQKYPSFLEKAVGRFLEFFAARQLKVTVFVVGRDAAQTANRGAMRAIAAAGHEIGNHSFSHRPWLHLLDPGVARDEVVRAEEAIGAACGVAPVGFRGPGHSLTLEVLETLCERGYLYDASTWPTVVMPLARRVYLSSARLTPEQRRERATLGGTFREALRPLHPYRWRVGPSTLIEIPITTLPLLRLPIHPSYLHALARVSPTFSRAYFAVAMRACRICGLAPSLMLHATDFLGAEDGLRLPFIPGIGTAVEEKVSLLGRILDTLSTRFGPCTLRDRASDLDRRGGLGSIDANTAVSGRAGGNAGILGGTP
jgi:peptidoglycan/xylan/chitin deacetylase (PgdA/CDA1 family)